MPCNKKNSKSLGQEFLSGTSNAGWLRKFDDEMCKFHQGNHDVNILKVSKSHAVSILTRWNQTRLNGRHYAN
jgi:hypothetical protein